MPAGPYPGSARARRDRRSSLSKTEVEAEVSRILGERVSRLRANLEALVSELLEPLSSGGAARTEGATRSPSSVAGDSVPDFLTKAVCSLAGSSDQIALLDRLLEGTARCFSRVCLFIVRGETAHGWSSVGLPETPGGDPAKGLTVPLVEDSFLRSAAEAGETIRGEVREKDIGFLPPLRPGDRVPERALAVPIVVQGKVAAILYADDGGDGREGCDFASAEILASVAALGANLLAVLSHPAPAEVEAQAEVVVRVPVAQEGGGLLANPDFLATDPLEEELSLDQPAGPPPDSPQGLGVEEARLHEDARRFARLLVSELLLYNENVVVIGRKNRDIYTRLKEDIEKSRQTYEQRIPKSISQRVDYFTQELVRTLAGGDPTALGPENTP